MRVELTEDAELDIEHIIESIAAEGRTLTAMRVFQRIREHILTLENFPERARDSKAFHGAHELVIKRLPYVAIFYIDGDVVRVVAVVHTRRRLPTI